jgi:hypothetical protein
MGFALDFPTFSGSMAENAVKSLLQNRSFYVENVRKIKAMDAAHGGSERAANFILLAAKYGNAFVEEVPFPLYVQKNLDVWGALVAGALVVAYVLKKLICCCCCCCCARKTAKSKVE